MDSLLTLFLGLVFVFALSMGGFFRETEGKKEIWRGAFMLAIASVVVGIIFFG